MNLQDHNENLGCSGDIKSELKEPPSLKMLAAEDSFATISPPIGQSSPKKARVDEIDELRSIQIECGCCHIIPKRAPLRGCIKGHYVCAACQATGGVLLSCPTCFSENLTYRLKDKEEALFTEVCNFAIKGCDMKISEEDRAYHEADCIYRVVQCPKRLFAKSCLFSDSLLNIREHARQEHGYEKGYSFLDSRTITSKMMDTKGDGAIYGSSARFPPIELVVDERLFYCYYERKHSRSLWFFFIRIYGSEDLAGQFKAEIHLGPGHLEKRSIGLAERIYRGKVVPYLMSREEIHESGLCFTVDDATVRSLKRDNIMFRAWWKISKGQE